MTITPARIAPEHGTDEACPVCGTTDECACRQMHQRLLERAARVVQNALEAANAADYLQAATLLTEASRLAPMESTTWCVLGLCQLAEGHTDAAAEAWARAVQLDPDSPARSYLTRLFRGDLAAALEHYNKAVHYAQAGDLVEAASRNAAALAELPGFAPAERLQRLLAAADRPPEAAVVSMRPSTELGPAPPRGRSLRAWARNGAAIAATAVLGLAVGWGLPRHGAPPQNHPSATGTPSPVPSALVRTPSLKVDSAELRRVAMLALAGVTDSLVQLLPHADSALTLPANPRDRLASALQRYARDEFRGGLRALANGDSAAAVLHFARAVERGRGTYVHDDALYGLARLQAGRGAWDDAREAAATLLRLYPTSIYANSVAARLARAPASPSSATEE